MPRPRAAGTDWREWRRLRAWELKQQGWRQRDIAAALGISEGAVSQWMSHGRQDGIAGLRHRPPPGPASRLTREQLAEVPLLLARGAEAFGFRGQLWTARRVTEVIRREFGVQYHVNYGRTGTRCTHVGHCLTFHNVASLASCRVGRRRGVGGIWTKRCKNPVGAGEEGPPVGRHV